MPSPLSLGRRLVLALFLAAVVPSGLLLAGGYLAFREVVVATGSAGPWVQVAESGQVLLEALEGDAWDPGEIAPAAARHRAELSESVRYSRIYALLGERILFLLPLAAGALLVVSGAFALWAARSFSRRISGPVEELVGWTERVGRSDPLPPPTSAEASGAPEFQELRLALRRMEGELAAARRKAVEQARMRSWTEMARRLAHDLKNPLTPMTMAARTAAGTADPRVAEAGAVLLEELRRLDEMARSLADFAQPPEGPPSRVDLGELLESLGRRLAGDAVPVEVRLPGVRGDAPPVEVEGHPLLLERVVRNLVVNAQEAVLDRGTSPPPPVELVLSRDGPQAVIRVLDRGPGLPQGTARRIWDPEFTTRRKGTGLGLAMVRQGVTAHGGHVEAMDREGGGAEFRIHLPLASGGPS